MDFRTTHVALYLERASPYAMAAWTQSTATPLPLNSSDSCAMFSASVLKRLAFVRYLMASEWSTVEEGNFRVISLSVPSDPRRRSSSVRFKWTLKRPSAPHAARRGDPPRRALTASPHACRAGLGCHGVGPPPRVLGLLILAFNGACVPSTPLSALGTLRGLLLLLPRSLQTYWVRDVSLHL
jgi:hypothetical protein